MVEIKNLTKYYGQKAAVKNISFTVEDHEILGFLGPNGAGKSTTMNIICGVIPSSSGTVTINGFDIAKDPIKAKRHIGFLPEIPPVYPDMKVKEYLTFVAGLKGVPGVKRKAQVAKAMDRLRITDVAGRLIRNLSKGYRQRVGFAQALLGEPDVLILDEPTAVLTPQETERLFQIMRKMKENGCAVIFISHKMNEVMEITDRVTVLRKGTTVQTLNTSETNPKELTELMVGRKMDLSVVRLEQARGELAMDVKDLTVVGVDGHTKLKNVSFDLYHGEILGVAGIAGSGQKELCEAIAGLQDVKQGEIMFKGQNLAKLTPRKIIELGIHMSFVPEDRLGMGLVAGMDMVDNLLLKKYQKQKGLFIDKKPAIAQAKKITDELEIVTPGISNYPVKNLSGGNIQKVLLGRELDLSPEVDRKSVV